MKVIRILEYEGPREWQQDQLERNGVKRFHRIGNNRVIRELVIGKETRLWVRLKLAVKIVRGEYA